MEQPKRPALILEARHSKCIEASKKIRSKLSPKLFIPRAPIYCHSAKTTSHFCRESKTPFFKNQNFTNFKLNCKDFDKESKAVTKKCQTQKTAEKFLKRLKGKYTKRPLPENTKTMEPKLGIIKIPKCRKKQAGSGITTTLKKSGKILEVKLVQKLKVKSRGKTEDDGSNKCSQNVGVITKKNSKLNETYFTDGEIVFLGDNLALDAVSKVGPEGSSSSQVMPMLVDKGEALQSFANFGTTNLSLENSSRRLTCNMLSSSRSFQTLKIQNLNQTKTLNKENLVGFKAKDLSLSSDVYSNNIIGYSSPNLRAQIIDSSNRNFTLDTSQNCGNSSDFNEYKQMMDEKIKTILNTKFYSRDEDKTIKESISANIPELQIYNNNSNSLTATTPATTNISKPRNLNNSPANLSETPKITRNITPNITKPPTVAKINFIPPEFKSSFNQTSCILLDFDNTIRSSLDGLPKYSINDEQIKENLLNAKISFLTFSKYLLKTYDELDAMERKTQSALEHINRKYLRRPTFEDQTESSSNSLGDKSFQADQYSDTVTILIDVEKMPTKTLTFKTTDILKPKLNNSDDKDKSSSDQKSHNSKVTIISNQKLPNLNFSEQLKTQSRPSVANEALKDNGINNKRKREHYSKANPEVTLETIAQTFSDDKSSKSHRVCDILRKSGNIESKSFNYSSQSFDYTGNKQFPENVNPVTPISCKQTVISPNFDNQNHIPEGTINQTSITYKSQRDLKKFTQLRKKVLSKISKTALKSLGKHYNSDLRPKKSHRKLTFKVDTQQLNNCQHSTESVPNPCDLIYNPAQNMYPPFLRHYNISLQKPKINKSIFQTHSVPIQTSVPNSYSNSYSSPNPNTYCENSPSNLRQYSQPSQHYLNPQTQLPNPIRGEDQNFSTDSVYTTLPFSSATYSYHDPLDHNRYQTYFNTSFSTQNFPYNSMNYEHLPSKIDFDKIYHLSIHHNSQPSDSLYINPSYPIPND